MHKGHASKTKSQITKFLQQRDELQFLTCRSWSNKPSPKSSTPALLLTTVRSFTLVCSKAQIKFSGMPHNPNPVNNIQQTKKHIHKFPDPWPWINNFLNDGLSKSSGCMSNTPVQLVYQESVKQLNTTPLNSSKRGESWQRPCTEIIIIIIYPLTARVVEARQMISQPVSSIFPDTAREKRLWLLKKKNLSLF